MKHVKQITAVTVRLHLCLFILIILLRKGNYFWDLFADGQLRYSEIKSAKQATQWARSRTQNFKDMGEGKPLLPNTEGTEISRGHPRICSSYWHTKK